MENLLNKYSFYSEDYVKFHEVDAFRVVHNLRYQLWAEVSRVEYCRKLGINIVGEECDFNIYLVHSSADYFRPAFLFDNYRVYTRVSKIGKTSVTFEHHITCNAQILCRVEAVEVYTDKNNVPMEVPVDLRNKVIAFEKELF